MKNFSKFVLLGALACCTMVWAVDKCSNNDVSGSISIENRDGMITAVYDGDSYDDVVVKRDCEIDYYVINRQFPGDWNKVSTMAFPFDVPTYILAEAGTQVYKITNIDANSDPVKFTAANWNGDTAHAYCPLFLRATSTTLSLPLYFFNQKPVILKASASANAFFRIKNGDGKETPWVFRSAVEYKKWDDGDADLGKVYGFVAYDINSLKQGEFKKIGAGSIIRSLRAYLSYEPALGIRAQSAEKTMASLEKDLPESIEVQFVDSEGNLTGITKMNTRTGEFADNKWFDVKGRKMNQMSKMKGSFYNGRKKFCVK